ncbi:MAG: tRNA-splicing endonuclease subunit [Bogoriella megaspora]|nr:MAG: tRNA-splicing endonuclease subunit [Bogoriella megaspora]
MAVGMAPNAPLPVPISQVAGRYFLYDADAITFLRREHNITGVLLGTLPQAPQQNVFSGIPLELMPEEARLLVENRVAYIIDDVAEHRNGLRGMSEAERSAVLAVFRRQGSEAARAAQNAAEKRKEAALRKHGIVTRPETPAEPAPTATSEETINEDESLFAAPANSFPTPSSRSSTPSSPASTSKLKPAGVTPATSYPPLAPPSLHILSTSALPEVPLSYPLFRHLHTQGYFLSPGLRFGAQYMAYPGDPLRFHSHFLAVGKTWEEEWDLGELVGGGRLGTGVKKGFLIGGEVDEPDGGHARHALSDAVDSDDIAKGTERKLRAFCIEWSGM